jgi:hypothetical protein
MPKIIYNGNGSTGGSAPVDNTNYAANASVTIAGPGNLTKGSSPFFYWNTKADGTGTIIGPGGSTFPNQSTNLNLFAVWGVTTGLTGGGVTTHFNFFYDAALGGAGGIEPARINQVLATGANSKPVIENDFDWLQAQFAGVDMTNGRPFPIPVHVTAVVEGGYNAGWGWPLVMNAGNRASTLLRSMFVAEVSEVFMLAQHKGWGYSNGVGDEESCGEALSLFLTVQFQLSQGLGSTWLMNDTPKTWLNTSLPASNPASTEFDATGANGGPSTGTHYGSRQDYVGSVKPFAGNGPATGACVAFLYYLFHQLQFTSIPDIIAKAPGVDSSGNVIGGSCLKGVYKNLTGDDSDPFPYFASLLATAYPPDQVANIPGPNVDDPWPIGNLSYVGAKDTWGRDEITDVINHGGTYPDGFLVALDGFSLNVVGGTRPTLPTIAFQGVTTALSATTPDIYHQSDNVNVPQQILFAYDVLFANPLGTFPASGETPAVVDTGITILGEALSARTEFFFTASATPYFTNVVPDPAHPNSVNVPWLSEDLRLFTATPGASVAARTPVPGGPQFVENTSGTAFDTAGAYTYVQALLTHLNQDYADGSVDPFDPASGVIPQQAGQLDADSSVTPFSFVNGALRNNYSFAIARVRLKGIAGTTSASNVKVFFRMWGTQTADTGWDPVGTYPSQPDGGGNPIWPKAPANDHTIPFFATSQQPNFSDPNDPEFKTGGSTGTGANNQTIAITSGDTRWAYFGCYLDVNDPGNVVNGTPIWQAFPGTHHCLVAEIAFAGTPIHVVNGIVPTPEGSGLLAQRNLQVTTSDNPGPVSAHRVPQTFATKPSTPPPLTGPLAGRPDELIIFWGDTPVGSKAQIYWPAVSADEVVKLADWMYGVHPLSAVEPHLIEVTSVKGVTFVPIPVGTAEVYAGLFSIDLPLTITTGQEFNVVVRRVSKRLRPAAPPPPPPPPPPPRIAARGKTAKTAKAAAAKRPSRAAAVVVEEAVEKRQVWERYIAGSFQVKIPVSTGPAMRHAEETTYAILKARLDGWSHASPWYPVLLRYVDLIGGRLRGIGVDPESIPPSLGGYRPGNIPWEPGERRAAITGKVVSLVYDRFGDFCGFVLDTEDGDRRFAAREPETERVVNRAWAERILTTVYVERHAPEGPEEIVLHSPPRPLTY